MKWALYKFSDYGCDFKFITHGITENIFDLCNQITTHYPASVRIFFPLLHQPKYKEV